MSEVATPRSGRARRLAVGFAGLALLATASGFAISVGTMQAEQPVPWVDNPVPRTSEPPQILAERAQRAPCQKQDLELLWPEQGSTFTDTTGGSDSTGFAVLVRNVGAGECTLSGHPDVQGVNREGEPVGPPAEPGVYLPSRASGGGRATIAPGEPARFFLSMASSGCFGPKITYHGADVVLDNGFTFTIKNAWLSGECPLKVSAWEPVTVEKHKFWALEARILAPSSAEAGSELSYVLELINVTSATIRFEPCLVFTHAIGPEEEFDVEDLDEMVNSTHRLNCSVNEIEPRAVVRYQMKFFIPSDFPSGRTILFWMEQSGGRPSAGTALIVDGAGKQPG